MKLFIILVTTTIALFSAGCSKPKNEGTSPPASFLDPAPSLPTSQTTIWAGINLMTEPLINDYIVVIHKNQLINWGKRGSVEVPNDSVGVDMRRYWIKSESGEPLLYDDSGKIDLSSFVVIKGHQMGVRPTSDSAKIVARIENLNLIFFDETEP